MKADKLISALENSKTSRVTLFLNERRVAQLFRDKVARINKIITSEELGPEFSSSLGGILGIKISAKKGISHDLDISPDEKALLIDIFEKDRGNMYSVDDTDIPKGALLSYVGQSQITLDEQLLTTETSMLPHNLTEILQQKRDFQAKGTKKGTIVWSSKSSKFLASICYMDSVVDPGIAYSYFKGKYGIMGTKEDELNGLITISPRWIWYVQESTNP